MKHFMILVNLFFGTPQILRLSLPLQLLDFVVVFLRRRIIAKPFSVPQVVSVKRPKCTGIDLA